MAGPFYLNVRRFLLAYEDLLERRGRLRMERRALRDATNPFELRDEEFISYFRTTKEVAMFVADRLRRDLHRQKSFGLTPDLQVLVTLRFLAQGSYQLAVGNDFALNVSQPSVSRCVKNVTAAIIRRLSDCIKMPVTHQDKSAIVQRFRPIAGFPGVIGAIDCTHIAIVTPINNPEGYRNHKGFHSFNVQMICDDQMHIMNVVAYPGSVHDQFIWSHSRARAVMKEAYDNGMGKFYVLGDSGYALEPFLMTPLPHAEEGTPEYRYTLSHCKARSVVERLFGVLKARWRCLRKDRVLHYQPPQAINIITACAILHNILLQHRMPLPDVEVEPQIPLHAPEEGDRLAIARGYQRDIIERYFR